MCIHAFDTKWMAMPVQLKRTMVPVWEVEREREKSMEAEFLETVTTESCKYVQKNTATDCVSLLKFPQGDSKTYKVPDMVS